MDIDRQRIAAVRILEDTVYDDRNGEWLPASAAMPSAIPLIFEADAMHGADAACQCAHGLR